MKNHHMRGTREGRGRWQGSGKWPAGCVVCGHRLQFRDPMLQEHVDARTGRPGRAPPPTSTSSPPSLSAYRQFYAQPPDAKLGPASPPSPTPPATPWRSSSPYRRRHRRSASPRLAPFVSSVSARRIWVLNDLLRPPDCRGQGVGRLLLGAARRHGVKTGAGDSSSRRPSPIPGPRLYVIGWVRNETSSVPPTRWSSDALPEPAAPASAAEQPRRAPPRGAC